MWSGVVVGRRSGLITKKAILPVRKCFSDGEPMEHIVQELADIVAEFLRQEGGYGNGYCTYAKGYVSDTIGQALEWSTPKKDDLTGHQVKDRGWRLNKLLVECLKRHGMKECWVEARHIEHGCFDTNVKTGFTKRVWIEE